MKPTLPRYVMWSSRLVVSLPLLALLVSSGIYFWRLAQYLSPRLAPVVAQFASVALKRDVRVQQVNVFALLGYADIRGIEVANGPTFARSNGPDAAAIPEIQIWYNFPRLLASPSDGISVIDRIVVTRPNLFVERFPDNKFNISDLLPKPPKPKARVLTATVSIVSGTLRFLDRAAPAAVHQTYNVFRNVDGTLDFSKASVLAFDFTAQGPANRLPYVRIFGTTPKKPPGPSLAPGPAALLNVQIAVRSANPSYLLPYFLPGLHRVVTVNAGTADAQIGLRQIGKEASLSITGSAQVHDGVAIFENRELLAQPISKVNGSLNFTNEDLGFSASAVTAGQSFTSNGSVLNLAKPRLAIAVDSQSLRYQAVRQALPFLPALPAQVYSIAPASAHVWLTGGLQSPAVDVQVTTPSVIVSGVTFRDARADAFYQNKILLLRSITASTSFSRDAVQINGAVDSRSRNVAFNISGVVNDINLASLPLPADTRNNLAPFDGLVSGTFNATEKQVSARIQGGPGEVKGISYSKVTGSASLIGGSDLDVHRLLVEQAGGGVLLVNGNVPLEKHISSGLSLSVDAAQLNVAQISAPFTTAPVGGLAFFRGSIHGSMLAPQIAGRALIMRPRYADYTADELQANLQTIPDGVRVARLTLRSLPASAVMTGDVTRLSSGDPALSLALDVRDAPLSELIPPKMNNAALSNLTGVVEGSIRVAGTVHHPTATGSLSLTDATYQAYSLEHVHTDIALRNNVINVNHFHAEAAGVTLDGSGSYSVATRRISTEVHASDTDITTLTHKFVRGVNIGGRVDITAMAHGPVSDLVAQATVNSAALNVEDTPLVVSPSTFRLERGMVELERGPFVLTVGDASYQVSSLSYNTKTQKIAADASVQNESIEHLLMVAHTSRLVQTRYGPGIANIIARLPGKPDGTLNVPVIRISGTVSKPDIVVQADLTHAHLGDLAISLIRLQGEYSDSRPNLQSLEFRGMNGAYIDASGFVDPQGAVSGQIDASNFDLSLLDPYLPAKMAAGGTVEDFTAVVSGKAAAPQIRASLTLDKPSYGAFAIDRLESGEIDVADNQIVINGLALTKEEIISPGHSVDHTLTLTGSIPFAWKAGGVLQPTFPDNVPVSLQANLPAQSLAFLHGMFPAIPLSFPSGTLAANLAITGTLADKNVNGNITVQNAAVQSPSFESSLRNVNIAIQLAGQTISVQKFSADSSDGGNVSLSGSAQFNQADYTQTDRIVDLLIGNLELNLKVAAQNFEVREKKLALFGNQAVSATLSGQGSIKSLVKRPMVAGDFTLSNVVGAIPNIQQTEGTDSGPPAFNPLFNLTVAFKEGSRIKSSLIDAKADGTLAFGGSLYRPTLKGGFLIRSGQFFFPTATFRIIPVGSVQFVYSASEGAQETVDLSAQTTISLSPTVLAANRPGYTSGYNAAPSTDYSPASGRYRITVHISGRLDKPDDLNLNFTSDPPGLTNAQILATLGGQQALTGLAQGNIESAVKNQIAASLGNYAVPMLLAPVESGIADLLGLEDFSIDYDPAAPVQLSLTKQLGPRVEFSYIQLVGARVAGAVAATTQPPDYQLKLSYSFTQRLRLSVSTDDQNNNIVSVDGVYNF